MNRGTLVMMAAILALNWGGFVFCLWYGSRRGGSRQ